MTWKKVKNPCHAVKRLRIKAKLSQYALAKAAGISSGHLNDIEAEKYQPGLGTLRKLAAGLGVELSELIG